MHVIEARSIKYHNDYYILIVLLISAYYVHCCDLRCFINAQTSTCTYRAGQKFEIRFLVVLTFCPSLISLIV